MYSPARVTNPHGTRMLFDEKVVSDEFLSYDTVLPHVTWTNWARYVKIEKERDSTAQQPYNKR